MVGTADTVLIREVSLIQSVLYREAPLYSKMSSTSLTEKVRTYSQLELNKAAVTPYPSTPHAQKSTILSHYLPVKSLFVSPISPADSHLPTPAVQAEVHPVLTKGTTHFGPTSGVAQQQPPGPPPSTAASLRQCCQCGWVGCPAMGVGCLSHSIV